VVEFRDEPASRATVIVVGLRDAPKLSACLDSIAASVNEVAFEVIVVLNDPRPALVTEIESHRVGARTFAFRANLGFGGAVNFAAERARGEYIVLLNDDCVVSDRWLDLLVETERRHARCAAVGSTLLDPDGTLQEAGALVWSDGSTFAVGGEHDAHGLRFERRVDYCSGGSLLVRKDVWDRLGGFDDAFYPAYFEDVDFCLRAAAAGWEVWYQPDSVVSHARWGSSEPTLRELLWTRAHSAFVERWSTLLAAREAEGDVERAVWKAMGEPFRVLVVGDRLPNDGAGPARPRTRDVLTALARGRERHVTFCATAPSRNGPPRCDAGVRVVDDLQAHLSTPGVEYDAVVVTHPHAGDAIRAVIDRYVPDAHRVYEASTLYHRQLNALGVAEQDGSRRTTLLRELEVLQRLELSLLHWADTVVSSPDVDDREAEEIRRLALADSRT
jgi:GT2 family glycosyltransferase